MLQQNACTPNRSTLQSQMSQQQLIPNSSYYIPPGAQQLTKLQQPLQVINFQQQSCRMTSSSEEEGESPTQDTNKVSWQIARSTKRRKVNDPKQSNITIEKEITTHNRFDVLTNEPQSKDGQTESTSKKSSNPHLYLFMM